MFSFLDKKDTEKIRKSKKITDRWKKGKQMFDDSMQMWTTMSILNERRFGEFMMLMTQIGLSANLISPEARREYENEVQQIRRRLGQMFVNPNNINIDINNDTSDGEIM
jgi:hypothetical protein